MWLVSQDIEPSPRPTLPGSPVAFDLIVNDVQRKRAVSLVPRIAAAASDFV
jgi:hypothetical protein